MRSSYYWTDSCFKRGKVVRLSKNSDRLILTIAGVGKLLALKHRIVIPFECIEDVYVNLDDNVALWQGFKMPATSVPGLVRAGTHLTREGKLFYLRQKGKESIILDLRGHKYKKVVVDVHDPIDAVSQILTWIEDSESVGSPRITVTR